MRSLLFTIWLKAAKDVEQTIVLVEQLGVAEYETVSQGGARIIRSSVAGKSFDFELPENWSAADLIDSLREIYKTLLTGGASGGQMTDAELQTYILDEDNRVSDRFQAVVGYTPNGGRI